MAIEKVNAIVTNSSSAGTSKNINLPGSLVTGNLLVAEILVSASGAHTWPAGWDDVGGHLISGGNYRYSVRKRIIDGSETTPITVTVGSGTHSAICTQISGHDVENTAIVFAANTAGFFSGGGGDPPSVDPSWDAGDTAMFLTTLIHRNNTPGIVTADPSGYTTNIRDEAGTDAVFGAALASAYKVATGDTENPGNYSMSVDPFSGAITMAIREGASGGGAGARNALNISLGIHL